MSSTLWRFSLRHTQRRPLRSLLTLVGIAIGVSTIVAVSLTIQTTQGAYQQMFDDLIGRASLEVVSSGLDGFDPETVDRVARLSQVETAVGVIQISAVMLTSEGPIPTMTLGIDPESDTKVRDYEMVSGTFLGSEPEVLVGTDFAASNKLSIGSSVRLLTSSGISKWTVCGILKPYGAARFNNGAIMFVPLAEAQRQFGLRGQINGIHVIPNEKVDLEQCKTAIENELPPELQVQTTQARAMIAQHSIMNLEQILAVMGVVSLVAGGFVILNTFQMNLDERRQQLAILRALGATKRQITRLLLREALVFGIAGTILGIALGVAMALVLLPGFGRVLGATIESLVITWKPFVLAIILGPTITLVATYLPARRAGRRFLLADLLARKNRTDREIRHLPRVVGIAMLLIAASIVGVFVMGWLPPVTGRTVLPFAMMFVVAGSVLVVPWLMKPLQGFVQAAIGRLFGIEGKLALRDIERNQSRTALTVGVLVVAIVVSVGPGNEITSAVENLYVWFDKVVVADYYIQAADVDAGFSLTSVVMPESLAHDISRLKSVSKVHAANFLPARANGKRILVIANDYSERSSQIFLTDDSMGDVFRRMENGEAVIGTRLAQELSLEVGDEIELAGVEGPTKLHIAGRAQDYHAGGMSVHLNRATASRLFALNGANFFLVLANRGQVREARAELEAFCKQQGLMMQTFADLRLDMEQRLAGTVGFLWVMMALVFVVASLATVNTLTMNVLDQTRELGMLRAIGMKRTQVRKMILAQGATIVLISLIPGILIGLMLALMMNLPAEQITGHSVPFQIRLWVIAGAVISALAATLAASWLPARFAAKIPIIRAIQYD